MEVLLSLVPAVWPRAVMFGVCVPAGIAVATGAYLGRPNRSAAAAALLVLAGVGSVVLGSP
jgi:hypothetical protein